LKAVFADTFFWVALTSSQDLRHREANKYERLLSETIIITSDEVLVEFLAFFSGDLWLRHRAAATVTELLTDRTVRLIPQSRQSFLAGFKLYQSRPDKAYSLTDCISMQIMRREGLTDVLTNDKHFEQEGFRAIFRD
jgi:uncharacterized protein